MSGPNPRVIGLGETKTPWFDNFFGYANPPLLLLNLLQTTIWPMVCGLFVWWSLGFEWPWQRARAKREARLYELWERWAFLDNQVKTLWLWGGLPHNEGGVVAFQAALAQRERIFSELNKLRPDLFPADVPPPRPGHGGADPSPLLALPPPPPPPPPPSPPARFAKIGKLFRRDRRVLRTDEVLAADDAARGSNPQ